MPAGIIALASFVLMMFAPARSAATPVPFAYVDNRMTIQCRINGTGPFTMIIDTGSPDVVIDPQAANVLGLHVRGDGSVNGAGNRTVQIWATNLREVDIGSQSFSSVPASVIDLSEIRTKLGFPHLDGVVGYSIMKRFAVAVDVDSQTISFLAQPPSTPPSASATSFTGVIPVVAATVDGIHTTVLIDTGDRSSLTLFGPFAKEHDFYARASQSNIITGYGLGGPVYADVLTLPSLDIFGRQLNAVVTRASRQTAGVFTGTEQGGSIGEGVLRRFNIIFDYPKQKIIAWPSKKFAEPDRFVPPPSTPAHNAS